MIQDIQPHRYDIGFRRQEPRPGDYLIFLRRDQVLLETGEGQTGLPLYERLAATDPEIGDGLVYLFSFDDRGVFYGPGEPPETETLKYQDPQIFRTFQPSWLAFAGITACHLAAWYARNKFCGRCAAPLRPSPAERSLVCGVCGGLIYPQIAPAVIVGVIDGEKLLLTRYAGGNYRRLALIAGFMEVGETPEDTVHREVQEEVGLKVKNIRYYKSQPWAFTQSLLLGFFAELDGSPEVVLDEAELSEAVWLTRGELPDDGVNISLTYEMIDIFRQNKVPPPQTR